MKPSVTSFFIISLFILLFCNCQKYKQPSSSEIDKSIKYFQEICDSLVYNHNTDSLRIIAKQLEKIAPEEETVLLAKLYYITAFFNAEKYETTIEHIGQLEKKYNLKQYPDKLARTLYLKARCFQSLKQNGKAIQLYKQILNINPVSSQDSSVISKNGKDALLQITNCYLTGNMNSKEGADYFITLQDSLTWLTKPLKRDIIIYAAYLYGCNEDLKHSFKLFDKAFEMPADSSYETRFRDYSYAGTIYIVADSINKAIEHLEKAADAGRKMSYSGLTYTLTILTQLYQSIGEFDKTLELYQELSNTKDITTDDYRLAMTEISFSDFYYDWGMIEEAMRHNQKAREYAMKSKNNFVIQQSLFSKLFLSVQNDNTDSLKFYLNIITPYLNLKKQDDQTLNYLQKVYNLYLGYLYYKTGRTDELKNIQLSLDENDLNPGNNLILAKLQYELGNYNICINRLELIVKDYEKKNKVWALKDMYLLLARSYANIHHASESVSYYEKYHQTERLYTKRILNSEIAKFKVKYETLAKEKENLALKHDLEKNRNHIQISVLTIIILIFLSLFIFYKNQLNITKRKLTESKLTHKEKDIMTFINHIKLLNSQKSELEEKLENVNSRQETNEIPVRLSTTSDEAEFRCIFTLRYPHFFPSLHKYPNITKSEEILCALILLNQGNNDIAAFLGISYESVLKARYRLRKKLNLKKDAVLDHIIKEISEESPKTV